MSLRLSLILALTAAASACTDPEPPGGPAVTSGVARLEIPISRNANLDLLFVVDSSPAIAPQRAKLVASYRRFMEALEASPGGLPDVHIGVVTADVGTRGASDASPGPAIGTGPGSCTSDGDRGELRRAASINGNFISDISRADGTRDRSYTGSLADAFVQLADAGASGCTYVRPLEAARRALADIPANAGFLRQDAYLGVVLLTTTTTARSAARRSPGARSIARGARRTRAGSSRSPSTSTLSSWSRRTRTGSSCSARSTRPTRRPARTRAPRRGSRRSSTRSRTARSPSRSASRTSAS